MSISNKRIFIIVDDHSNRAIMQVLLEKHGAHVAFERWGREVIQRLRAFAPIDIILLDLMFPNNVTGYDIFDEIRTIAEFNHIPIVAVSASDASQSISLTRKKGFAGFIAKPIDFFRFPEQIDAVLRGEQIWRDT
jgi:CheY-like chemotaxis protein